MLVLDASGEALALVDERWQPAAPNPVPPDPSPIPVDASVCGTVFRSGAPVLIADVRQHPVYRVMPGAVVRSELAVPVLRSGRTIAVINVQSPRVGGLDIADLDRLTGCAASAATMAPADLRPIPEAA